MKKKYPSFVVVGTGTDVGKTVVTGLIAEFLRKRGVNVTTQKWVQTGARRGRDIDAHDELMGVGVDCGARYRGDRMPYSFVMAASPHCAARVEKKQVKIDVLKKSLARLRKRFECVVVEASGGVLVPLTQTIVTADVIARQTLPVIVVAENVLGAINHTLLTIEALRRRKITIIGVVFNRRNRGADPRVCDDNRAIVAALGGVRVLGEVGFEKNRARLVERFSGIGAKIYDWMKTHG